MSADKQIPQYEDSQDLDSQTLQQPIGISKNSKKVQKISNQKKQKLNGKPLASQEKVSCKFCGKTYTNKYSMHTHMKSLHKTKPHQCDVCNEGFWEIKELKAHMETLHLNYLVEQCRIEKQQNDQSQQLGDENKDANNNCENSNNQQEAQQKLKEQQAENTNDDLDIYINFSEINRCNSTQYCDEVYESSNNNDGYNMYNNNSSTLSSSETYYYQQQQQDFITSQQMQMEFILDI